MENENLVLRDLEKDGKFFSLIGHFGQSEISSLSNLQQSE